MRKAMKIAAGMWMIAAAAMAQTPQVSAEMSALRLDAAKTSVLKQVNMDVLKARPAMALPQGLKANKQITTDKNLGQMTGIRYGQPKVMTRAGQFGAYYERPAGLYNIKPGFQYRDYEAGSDVDSISRHGILAPIFKDVTYTNASTGATNIDWLINGTVDYNESIVVTYLPGTDFYVPMPELTAYDAEGNDSIYQYGYCYNPDLGIFTEGQAVTDTWGMVSNLDAGAESFYNTYIMTKTGTWAGMLFGSDTSDKPSYFEIFEKPLYTVFLNSVYLYVATATGADLSSSEFSMWCTVYDDVNGWTQASTKVSATPQYLGSLQECDIWHMQIYFEKPVKIDQQFGLIFDGPQDETTAWAFLHQVDRDVNSGIVTAGYIPSTGDYAGYMMPYGIVPDGATEAVAYPASIDLGLQVFMPYNMVFNDTEYLNYGDIAIPAEGLSASAYLWNWEAYIMGGESSMKITSDASWLKCELTRTATNDNFLHEIMVTAEVLPEGVAGRKGTLTFTDGQGYQSTWTFIQGDEAAGIDKVVVGEGAQLDLNAPIYDLTGRQVSNPVKGIYLQNGKKFVVE